MGKLHTSQSCRKHILLEHYSASAPFIFASFPTVVFFVMICVWRLARVTSLKTQQLCGDPEGSRHAGGGDRRNSLKALQFQ